MDSGRAPNEIDLINSGEAPRRAMRSTDQAPALEWLIGGGELGELIRTKDWSTTPLGPREQWGQSLRTVLCLVVENMSPMALLWGPELSLIYNDAYRRIAADKHPAAFFPINRRGRLEHAYFSLCYGPVRLPDGSVGGTLVTLHETTEQRRSERALNEAQRVLNIGSWEWDLKTGEMRWSRQLYVLYGLDPNEFTPTDRSFSAIIHPDDVERVEQTIREPLGARARLPRVLWSAQRDSEKWAETLSS